MRTTATLSIRFEEAGARQSLTSVLAPDNEGAPRGLKLTMVGRGKSLVIRVECASTATAISTTLAVLRDISLFQEVWLLSHAKDAASYRA